MFPRFLTRRVGSGGRSTSGAIAYSAQIDSTRPALSISLDSGSIER